MRTRNQAKNIPPQVIQIDSDASSSQHLKDDDSSCSEASNSSIDQSESDSQAFFNLMPTNEKKSKKQHKEQLKNFLFEKKQVLMNINPEQYIQRAPVLNLLRPFNSNQKTQQKTKEVNLENSEEQSNLSIQPPSVEESDQQVKAMSQPRKKPKLMEQIEKQLNMPAEQYVVTGAGKQIRQQRKRQNKRRDYLIEKKFKQYRVGKKKDNVSNQVFNAIEDFFA